MISVFQWQELNHQKWEMTLRPAESDALFLLFCISGPIMFPLDCSMSPGKSEAQVHLTSWDDPFKVPVGFTSALSFITEIYLQSE